MRIRFRTVFWTVVAVLVAVGVGFAFRPQPIAVDVAQAERGPMQVTVRDEGRTRVRNEYVVSAPVGGRLLRVDYKPGALVAAGDTVARIQPGAPAFLDSRALAEAQASLGAATAALAATREDLERARAQAGYARAEEERVAQLRSRDLVSVESLDRARLDLRVAESALGTANENVRMREAELAAAQTRLLQPGSDEASNTVVNVIAPVPGRVLRVARESETIIPAGAEVMTLGDPSKLEIVVEMLSTDAVQVRPGAQAIIDNWGRNEAPLRGEVRLVEPYGFLKISALGVEEQRVNVIVDFAGPASEWSTLGHGYRVEAAIVTWQEDDVIQVPVAALFRNGAEWAVFRVVAGRAQLSPVEVGRDNSREAQILAGLADGDTLILYPGDQISDGVSVSARNP